MCHISKIKKDLARNPNAEMLYRILDASKQRGPTAVCSFILDVHCRQRLSIKRSAELTKSCIKATQFEAFRDITSETAAVHSARAVLWAIEGATVSCLSYIAKCPTCIIDAIADKIVDKFDCETSLDDYCVLLHKTLRMDVVKFKFETVDAHISLDKTRSEIVVHSIVNHDTGNGKFQAFLVWLKAKCAKENLNLVFADIINDRLCLHLQRKQGFKLRKPKQGVFTEAILKLGNRRTCGNQRSTTHLEA